MVPCQHCGEKMLFPAAQRRSPVLFCKKCGSRTSVPWFPRWLVVLGVVILLSAAVAFFVVVMWKENAA